MEIFKLQADVHLICMDVPTFPNGIPEVFDKLSKKLPTVTHRVFYGISYMDETQKIIYKAAVASSADEAEQLDLETFTIQKGEYLTKTILDWMKNIPEIGKTFQEMMKDERVDKTSVCIEWYKTNNELMCMAKIK